jgi:glutaredoxin
MEQRCHISMVWLTWLGLPLMAATTGCAVGVSAHSVLLGAVIGVFVLAVGAFGQVLYVRLFPRMSGAMGYGSIADVAAASVPTGSSLPRVTLYTANVCPFCPIIRRRLAELQRRSGFELEEIDITFRPEILRAKGLQSVPVIEANGRLLVGNATSAQVAEFLMGAPQ